MLSYCTVDVKLLQNGWLITAQWMGDYCRADGELLHTGWFITAHGWVKTVPELLTEAVKTVLRKINVNGYFSRPNCALSEVKVFL